MTKPDILTSEFWTPRINSLTENIGRVIRTMMHAVALAYIGSLTDTVKRFDWKIALAAAGTGAALSLATSFAKPPKPPGGDPAVDNAIDPPLGAN